ncbi:DUF6284 family protein [Streptomyces sp. NPDC059991]|uniref:DUF6284 family protein n=1 Tax=Streptomyces sp. NPDC059991 TaxID=3347028 RepID=UPI003684AE89
MENIAALQKVVTAALPDVELLDARIKVLDRPVSELDARRIRRARRRVLVARRDLINRAAAGMPGVA